MAPACKSCRGKRCNCEPQEMEIAVYCNCRMDIHEFLRMKFLEFNRNPEAKRKAHENSIKNIEAWIKELNDKKAKEEEHDEEE
jgi:hypothetical protein